MWWIPSLPTVLSYLFRKDKHALLCNLKTLLLEDNARTHTRTAEAANEVNCVRNNCYGASPPFLNPAGVGHLCKLLKTAHFYLFILFATNNFTLLIFFRTTVIVHNAAPYTGSLDKAATTNVYVGSNTYNPGAELN